MSDVDIMAALIQQHGEKVFSAIKTVAPGSRWQISPDSARAAAKALYDTGFRLGAGTVDREQNERLRALEARVTRVEGWAGIPSGL